MRKQSGCRGFRAFLRHAALASTAVLVIALTGCSDDNDNFDITSQIGPDPVLPEPSQSLVPDLKVALAVYSNDHRTTFGDVWQGQGLSVDLIRAAVCGASSGA